MKKRTISLAVAALLAIAAVPTIAFASAQPGVMAKEPAAVQGVAGAVPAAIPAAVQDAVQAVSAVAAPAAEPAVAAPAAEPAAAGPVAPVCAGFVDADNDGVCDNYAAGTCDGTCRFANGAAAGPGGGCADGAGFVDADGNGVCDNYDAGACPGGGAGRGHGYGHGSGSGHHGRGC